MEIRGYNKIESSNNHRRVLLDNIHNSTEQKINILIKNIFHSLLDSPITKKIVNKILVASVFGKSSKRDINQDSQDSRDKLFEKYPTINDPTIDPGKSLGVREHVTFNVDNTELKGTLVKPKDGSPQSGKTYIFCSGSYGRYDEYVKSFKDNKGIDHKGILDELVSKGHQVLLFDYRGFGENFDKGPPSAEKVLEDAEAAYTFIKGHEIKNGKKIDDSNIVMHGYSLGGAVAAKVASNHSTDLILDRVFAESGQVAYSELPKGFKKVGQFVTNKFFPLQTAEYIKKFKGNNITIIHENDESFYKLTEKEKLDGQTYRKKREDDIEKAVKMNGRSRKDKQAKVIVKEIQMPHVFDESHPPPVFYRSLLTTKSEPTENH